MTRLFALTLCLALASTAQAEITFEAEDPAPQSPPVPTPPVEEWSRPELSLTLAARAATDLAFDAEGENVVSLLRKGRLSLVTKHGKTRMKLSARARWVTSAESLDGTRRRSTFDLLPSETAIETTWHGVELSAGLIEPSWGQNPLFSAADVLSPVDLRDGPFTATDARLATPGLRARGSIGDTKWDAVYLPLFMPSKLPLFGNDWSPFAAGRSTLVPDVSRLLDPTLLGSIESTGLATRLPQNDLTSPQGGLRVSHAFGDLEVALTWAEHFDRMPRATYSPSFERLLDAISRKDSGAQLSALVNVQDELAKGGTPLLSEYVRTRTFALDAAWLIGPVRLTLDAGFSPLRVFPTFDLRTTTHPAGSGALGLEYAGDTTLACGIATQAAFGVPVDERLLFLDDDASTRPASVAMIGIGYLFVAHRWFDDRLRAQFSGLASHRGDFLATPQVTWAIGDAHRLSLGALLVAGPSGGPGAIYHRNNEAYFEYIFQL